MDEKIKSNLLSFINEQSQLSFDELCLQVFKFQYTYNSIYHSYVDGLKVKTEQVKIIEQIPFLPIEFFKTQTVKSTDRADQIVFTSSGTTGERTSKHRVADLNLYKTSFKKDFEFFYGNVKQYCILALLPNYLEREGSSLVYMTEQLIKDSENPNSGFFLHNLNELKTKLIQLETRNPKPFLLGVTYALLDFAEFTKGELKLKNTIIMETGGMKGKRKEMVRGEVHSVLKNSFGVNTIHSEYGMTELLSQAYSKGDGIFVCPPWMKVFIRDVNDPLSIAEPEKTGGINVIDLANIYSCSFIATQDLGKIYSDNSFEVLGRFDNSDVRGCNLLV